MCAKGFRGETVDKPQHRATSGVGSGTNIRHGKDYERSGFRQVLRLRSSQTGKFLGP